MANIKDIPKIDHFLRRALPQHHLVRDHGSNKVIGFYLSLFRYRSDPEFIKEHGKEETSLSINWVEFFEGMPEQQQDQALEDYRSGLLALPMPIRLGKCYFTKLNVGEFKARCAEYKAKPRVIHDGKPTKSHGGITQLPQDNRRLLEALANMAFQHLLEKNFKNAGKM